MLIYIIKRICSFLVLLFLLSLLCVSIIYFSPNTSFNYFSFLDTYFSFYQQLLFNHPITISLSQYTIMQILMEILIPTFEFCLLAIFLSIIIGFPIGIILGLSNNNKFNYVIRLVCLILYASPLVWIAILIITFSSVNWEYIRHTNYIASHHHLTLLDIFLAPDNSDKLTMLKEVIKQLILPVLILTIQPCITTIQLVSEHVALVANKNYIKVAALRENSSLKVLFRHLLPNAIPGIIPQLTYNITTLLFYAMIIEIILNRSGIGTWVMSAFYHHDYSIIGLTILSCGIIISLLTLLSEIFIVIFYPIQSRSLYE